MLEGEKRKFKHPPNKFRLAPFWFWNHELTDDELRWQIREMNRQGVGGFIMHARHGLITPYLSPEWMDRCQAAIEEADHLGMKAYLYDENNWPSGPADGKVTDEHPEFRQSALRLSQEWKVRGRSRLEEDLELEDGMIAVVAVPLEKGKIAGFPQNAICLNQFVSDGRLSWQAPGGQWLVMAFVRRVFRGGFFGFGLDYLNKDAVGKFIEVTHAAYAQRFSQYFGGTVNGIFTDEPAINFQVDDTMPWTAELPSEFAWEHGYDPLPILPALFKEVGEETAKIRCDFWETVTRLYEEGFYQQISDFCEDRRLNFIGHLLGEGEFYSHARYHGDFFRCQQWMHSGGIDQLCEETWPQPAKLGEFRRNNLLAPKFGSSAAHLLDKPTVMSECFGLASQWEINLRTLKWLADWQIALGVNLLQPHAFYYSIQGFRKWECPPGEFYQSPFWPYYREFADYCARLCSLFSEGSHQADVAVLYPIKSMWANLHPSPDQAVAKVVAGLEKVSQALLRIHRDFDIVPEEMFQQADVYDTIDIYSAEGKLLHQFKALIIPTSTTLSRTTMEQVQAFYESGGTIVLTGMIPQSSPGVGEDRYLRKIAESIFGRDFDEEQPISVSNRQGGRAIFLPKLESLTDHRVERLLQESLAHLPAPVSVEQDGKQVGDIIYLASNWPARLLEPEYRGGDTSY